MSPVDGTNEQFTDQQPRCEIGKTLVEEGVCKRPGEVQLDGSVLCVGHAELLKVRERSKTMLGKVFEMDQWLESVEGEADELGVRRAEHRRNDLVEQLRFDLTRMDLVSDKLLKD